MNLEIIINKKFYTAGRFLGWGSKWGMEGVGISEAHFTSPHTHFIIKCEGREWTVPKEELRAFIKDNKSIYDAKKTLLGVIPVLLLDQLNEKITT